MSNSVVSCQVSVGSRRRPSSPPYEVRRGGFFDCFQSSKKSGWCSFYFQNHLYKTLPRLVPRHPLKRGIGGRRFPHRFGIFPPVRQAERSRSPTIFSHNILSGLNPFVGLGASTNLHPAKPPLDANRSETLLGQPTAAKLIILNIAQWPMFRIFESAFFFKDGLHWLISRSPKVLVPPIAIGGHGIRQNSAPARFFLNRKILAPR